MVGGWMRDRYLDRLQVEWTGSADEAGLRRLHRRHLETIPFENLSIHLGEPIVLDEVELVAKIALRRRGGFCYELNGAFAWLLRNLGYHVELLEAGVFHDGAPGPHFDHLVLRVALVEAWLVDVGFGDNHSEPVPLRAGVEHVDPNGTFRLVDVAGDRAALDLLRDGEAQYRLGLRPHPLTDFEAMCRFHQRSPESHFTRNTVCSMATAGGRATIRGRTLIATAGGVRHERQLGDDELLACYRETFGIDLERLPPQPDMAQ
jgi:N-hydroxyarylamine O-acetyltransferase